AVAGRGPEGVELLPRALRLGDHLDVLRADRRGLLHAAARINEGLVKLFPRGRDRVPEADDAGDEEAGVGDALAEVGQVAARAFVIVEFAFPRLDRVVAGFGGDAD